MEHVRTHARKSQISTYDVFIFTVHYGGMAEISRVIAVIFKYGKCHGKNNHYIFM